MMSQTEKRNTEEKRKSGSLAVMNTLYAVYILRGRNA